MMVAASIPKSKSISPPVFDVLSLLSACDVVVFSTSGNEIHLAICCAVRSFSVLFYPFPPTGIGVGTADAT